MEIATDFAGLLRLNKDGSVIRFFSAPYAASFPDHPDPETSVFSEDINITFPSSCAIPARIYRRRQAAGGGLLPRQRLLRGIRLLQLLPQLLLRHPCRQAAGGGLLPRQQLLRGIRLLQPLPQQRQVVNHLAANALVITVDYRLAPEHHLPAAYEDGWAALQGLASHSSDNRDLWVTAHADFEALFVGGDSASANIAHNLAIRAGDKDLPGTFLFHFYLIDGSGSGKTRPDHIAEGKWSTAPSYKI